jgi:hypothetical protein
VTISTVANQRKRELKALRTALIQTEAGFRAVRREVDRLYNRKKSLPEAKDLEGLIQKALNADAAFDRVTGIIQQAANAWR